MTIDDHLAARLRRDSLAFPGSPSRALRARTLDALAHEPTPRTPWTHQLRRAAAIAATLAIASLFAWWATSEVPAADAPTNTATAWVIETVGDGTYHSLVAREERGPITPTNDESVEPLFAVPANLPFVGAGEPSSSWTTAMFTPFEGEWHRVQADAARATAVVWTRVAKPLRAVLLRR